MEAIKKYFIKITQAITYIRKLNDVLKQFFIIKNAKEIKFLEYFEREIKEGNMNILEKEEIKEKYNKIHTFVPDLDKKILLKESIFFSNFFKTLRDNEPLKNEDDIFKETENDFEKLKLLFNDNWINKIDERIIKEIYRSIKDIDEKAIEKELNLLKEFFKLENINPQDITRIQEEIITFSKKNEEQIQSESLNKNIINLDINKENRIIEENLNVNIENNINEKKLNLKKDFYIKNFSLTIDNENFREKEEFDKFFEEIKDGEKNDKRNILKNSIIFYNLFKNKRENNKFKLKNEIFNEAENDFKTIKLLFEENWTNTIDKIIIKQLFKIIMKLNENQIENEINLLKEYFNINIIDDLKIKLLKDEIKIYAKK